LGSYSVAVRSARVLFLLTIATVGAFAQVQQSNLITSLKDIETTSQVTIGSAGFPAGVSGMSGLPVNTLAYPDGQIIYRVEFGLTRGEVVQMRESFGAGTVLQVKSVEFKDDRLELKLRARNGDSGRIKLMLGANWQGRMTNAGVLEILSKFLTLPSPPVHDQAVASPSGASYAQQSNTLSTPAPILYSRPSGVAVIPGRLSESDVQSVLADLQQQKRGTDSDVRRSAATFAQAFQAFESAYSRERGNRAVQGIDQLRSRLGNDFIPRTAEDIASIRAVFSQCLYLARIRGTVDNSGRPIGPGANSSAYQKAFPGGDIGEAQLHSTDALGTNFEKSAQIANAEEAIIHVEQILDAGQLASAEQAYQQLSGMSNASLSRYIHETSALRNDLDAFVAAQRIAEPSAEGVIELLRQTASEESALSQAAGKPITTAYLQPHMERDKVQLHSQLQSIPAYQQPHAIPTPAHLSEAEAGVRLTNITDSLRGASTLIALTKDQTALESIQRWYGSDLYKAVLMKADGITDAESAATRLEGQIQSTRDAQKAEIARKQALADQRAALAGNIVNTVLIVTKLDEQFNRTQIMGYSMEAQKQRTQLRTLINENRAALSSGMWSNVRARFQQILPGLTVWEASHAQALLSESQR
jgi:hypothetical protein